MATASPAQVLATLLVSKNVGTLTEGSATSSIWAIKFGRRTDVPDELIVLTDSGGSNPNTKFQLDFVHVQALIRAKEYDYLVGRSKAQEVKDALLGLDSQDVVVGAETVRVSGITMNGDIAFVRYDENERPLFSVNLRIMMERAVNALSSRDSL